MTDTGADAYLRDVRSRIDTLQFAPAPESPGAGDAIAERVEEWHACDRCGAIATVAYITQTDPPRWLDLCAGDARWLLGAHTPAWPGIATEDDGGAP